MLFCHENSVPKDAAQRRGLSSSPLVPPTTMPMYHITMSRDLAERELLRGRANGAYRHDQRGAVIPAHCDHGADQSSG